mgnify:CR=1 FL=1
MKTLYVSDLDGTLLSSKRCVSENSIRIINELIEKGMLFTYATARSLSSASVVTKGLQIKTPIIAYNGAHIFDPQTGKRMASEGFGNEEVAYVKGVLEQQCISPLVYAFVEEKETVSWVKGTETVGVQSYLDSRKNDKRMRGLETVEKLYEGEVFYFTCIGEKEQFEQAYDILKKDERLTCTFQPEPQKKEEYWLEIMPRKATKANAITKLKEILGCDEIISFGDAMNDIPMFQISDECYAMENAVDALKEIATEIIASNDADGVAKWLCQHAKW